MWNWKTEIQRNQKNAVFGGYEFKGQIPEMVGVGGNVIQI
jgi:hypothetical protein